MKYSESVVIQKYITNPLLLDGYKFYLRLYVVVTSFQPLEAFLYQDGFARFALDKFNTQDANALNVRSVRVRSVRIPSSLLTSTRTLL